MTNEKDHPEMVMDDVYFWLKGLLCVALFVSFTHSAYKDGHTVFRSIMSALGLTVFFFAILWFLGIVLDYYSYLWEDLGLTWSSIF
jgi:hypothetical protein